MSDTVWLQRPSAEIPWGFRLAGGSDLQQALIVQRVTAGSIAATGLNKGDLVVRIGDSDTATLTNMQANECIKKCGNLLQLHIAKPGVGTSSSPGAPPPMGQQSQPAYSPVSPASTQPPPSHQPTRLEQQLSNISMGEPIAYPFANEQPSSLSPSAPGGPGPGYGQPSFIGPSSTTTSPNKPPPHSPEKPPAMPDAVLNMAAKGPMSKKPWAYAPDMDSIQSQRDKIHAQRKKAPPGGIPRYQHMLNMPDFSDPPTPPHLKQQQQQQEQNQKNPGNEMEDGMYMHAQYNSPLQMYSNENVNDAFVGQTQGEIMGMKPGESEGAPTSPKKDIVMSPTYRLIHGLDKQKPKPRIVPPPEARHMVREPDKDDELKFSGLVNQSEIPSKSFHRLQQQIGESEVGTTPIRPGAVHASLGVDEVGNYDETSIRYRGRNIPSKSFRMLQNLTGGPMSALPADGQTSTDGGSAQSDNTDVSTERRRRHRNRSKPVPKEEEEEESTQQVADFDEKAYLSGRVQIVSGSVNNPQAAVPFDRGDTKPQEAAPSWQKQEDEEPQRDFDESSFLAGRYAIINDEAKPLPVRGNQENGVNGSSEEAEMEKEKRFDEAAFLQGKIPLFGDTPKEYAPREKVIDEKPLWRTDNVDDEERDFDEDDFLSGQVSILGGSTIKCNRPWHPKVQHDPAPWERKGEEDEEMERRNTSYSEHAFLSGHIPLVRGDGAEPTALATVPCKVKPKRKEEDDEGPPMLKNFDEDAFLQGKINILGGDSNPSLPPRESHKKPEKELASWQKRRRGVEGLRDDTFNMADQGGVPLKGGFDQIPSRKFTMLRRSMSRDDRSPSRESDSSGYTSPSINQDEESSDPDRVIKKLAYKGSANPSRTFMRLQQKINRGPAPKSVAEPPTMGLDVDEAMDKMAIQNNDPDEYFEQLKKSMQEQDVKIEPEEEITDF